MELEKELQELVNKHLPQATGEALRKRLDEADRDAKLVEIYKGDIQRLNEQALAMEARIRIFESNQARIEVIEKGEKDLANNQRNLELEKMKYQLESEKEKTKMAVELNMSLTRNTLFRKDIFDSENQSGYAGPNGVWVYPTPVNKHFNETKSEA